VVGCRLTSVLPRAAVVTESGAHVIFRIAFDAVGRKLAAGHRDKWPIIAVNNFQIADNKGVVKGNTAESS
jgi:hypothetical protein